ncbi:MAG TPA: HEAT repeat domain-containing protein [Polyangiaceae bacterium]|nr:HEAT repeat domain-containing protein [Polyangiaceae bacterium]
MTRVFSSSSVSRAPPIQTALMAATFVLLSGGTARADVHAVAPEGGGLAALDVRADLDRGVVLANDLSIPIGLDKALLPAAASVTVEALAIGLGKHVVHVRIPARGQPPEGLGWEAVMAAGRPQPIFAGITGFVSGDSGERSGTAVKVVADGPMSYVLVGDIHEDLRICGQAKTLLDPRALYPASLELRPATVQRLDSEQRDDAETTEAKASGGTGLQPPLARLLVARGSSVPGSRGLELTDGDPKTSWQEQRPGIGQGEFVVMAAPREVPITRAQVVLSPPKATAADNGAAPKTFYLVTSTRTIRVRVPDDPWRSPGHVYEVAFDPPIEDSCVSLVLDDAYARGLAHPDVGVAELVAYSDFDTPGATLDDVAALLSTTRGAAAAQVLERAGPGALAAVTNAYDSLDIRGRAFAIDVAASGERCEEAAPLLSRAACETSGEAPRKAREKLERCEGAAPALSARIRDDAGSRACLAPLLASMFPDQAIAPIADAMGATPEADTETRAALRSAFSAAVREQPAAKLAALLIDRTRTPAARLEIMRAVGGRVTEAAAESNSLIDELLSGTPPMRTRYLVLGPLGVLARAGDAAALRRIGDTIVRDSAWPVRARAADVAAGDGSLQPSLIAAAADAEPRVREAALASLASAPAPAAAPAAVDRLVHDGWWFVRVQAARVLAASPARSDADDALSQALEDPSAKVRGSAIVSLARHRATASRKKIRSRLDDPNEDHDVRAQAAAGLGELCDVESTDRLAMLARKLASSDSDAETQLLGLGALRGLAVLHPPDLNDRLAPLLAPGAPAVVRAAAKRALAAPGACK